MPFDHERQYQAKAEPTAWIIASALVGFTVVNVDVWHDVKFQYQSVAAPVFTPVAEEITPDKWYQGLAEPVRQQNGLAVQNQQSVAFPVSVVEEITTNKWFNPFSEPRRFRVSVPDSQQPPLEVSQPADTEESQWHQPWSEPIRQSRADQQMFTTNISPFQITAEVAVTTLSSPVIYKQRFIYQSTTQTVFVQPEIVTTDKWFIPWIDPVRQKPGLSAQLQQFFTIDPAPVAPEVVTSDKWYAPWREPVRQKPGIPSQLQQSFTTDSAPVPPETVTLDKWYASWREPVRQKQGLGTHEQQFLIFTSPIFTGTEVATSALSSTVIYKKRFIYQSFTTDPAPTEAEVVTLDKWYAALREPVWPKRGLRSDLQSFYASDTQPVPTSKGMGWFEPISEPVRLPNGLKAYLQRFHTSDAQPIPTSKGMGWFSPLTEPYPFKRGLKTHLQQFVAIDTVLPPNPNRIIGWYDWLSEPVRLPRGLRSWLQETTAQTLIPPDLLPAVTVTLFAVETNSDSFLGAVVVEFHVPTAVEPRALVSIEEVSASLNTPTSIWES